MKRNDSGDFCVLFVEEIDERAGLFEAIIGQKKPIVLLLSEQVRLFQRPDDFNALKHVKRQLDRPVVFVIPNGERQAQLAVRHGFSVYTSMDALSDALLIGQATRQRVLNRATVPLYAGEQNGHTPASRRGPANDGSEPFPAQPSSTIPLPQADALFRRTGPLVAKPVVLPAKPSEPLTPAPPVSTVTRPVRPSRRKRQVWPIALLVLLAVALTFAGVGSFLVFSARPLNNVVAVPAVVGHAAFVSSEQVSENSSQGIMDQVSIDLANLSNPAAGKSYYAWLLGDKQQSDPGAVYLGQLQVVNSHAHLFYPGDAAHTNLLLTNSRFLVTEEDSTLPPITPSPDQHVWRYYGEFVQTPVNSGGGTQPFSYLDHLRHLLASDPTLDDLELPGGLNNWMFRNTGKVLEWASSLREQWEENKDPVAVRREAIRMLTYLDGLSFVKQDLALGTPLLVNERLARVGLVCVNGAAQDPPCYVAHIAHHLNGLLQVIQPTPELRKNIADLVSALNNVTYWLTQLRIDAQQAIKMSDQQLRQPPTLTLINDMISNANHAYTGENDPATGEMHQGVMWAHTQMQALATIAIKTFTASSSSLQMVPNIRHVLIDVPMLGAEL